MLLLSSSSEGVEYSTPAIAVWRASEHLQLGYKHCNNCLIPAGGCKFQRVQATPIYLWFMATGDEDSLALERAISSKQMDVVEYLLNLDEEGLLLDLVSAFDAAIVAGLNDLADRVFEIYSRMYTRNDLLLELAGSDCLDGVKHLLGEGVELAFVDELFESAAMGSVAVVEFLWTSFTFSSEVFDRVFERAATNTFGWNKYEMIPSLYKKKRPSPQVIDRVFRATDSVVVLKLLLDNEQISNDAMVAAFEHAASAVFKDKFAVLELLYKRECTPSAVLTEALVVAASHGNTEVVELLRGDTRIATEAVEQAFLDMALGGSANRMEKLCDSQLVAPEVIFEAFTSAVTAARVQTVAKLANYLSTGAHVPRHLTDSALVFSAKHGQLQAVEILDKNEKGEWSLSVLREALAAARNNPVRNYIRTITCNQLFDQRGSGRFEAVVRCLADWSE